MPFNCWPKHGVISRLMKWVWNVRWNEGFVAIEAPKGDIQSEPTSHSNTTRQRQVFYLTSNLDTHMSKLCVQLVGSCSSDALHEECMPSLVTSFSTTVSTLPSTNSLHRNVAALGAEAMMKNSSNQTQVWADGRTRIMHVPCIFVQLTQFPHIERPWSGVNSHALMGRADGLFSKISSNSHNLHTSKGHEGGSTPTP